MMITPDETWHSAGRTIGKEVRLFNELPSTNDAAAVLAHDPVNHGLAIIARHQSAGRGQHGRNWQAGADSSLLVSIIVPPLPLFQRPVIMTAWAAVGIAGAVEALTRASAQMKWPNDLLVQGRKICGILIETGRGIVLGFGLNLNQTETDFRAAGLPEATSLRAITGRTFGIRETFDAVAEELEVRFLQLQRGDSESLKDEWIGRTGLLGRDVRIERYDGSLIEGRLSEMSFDGLILNNSCDAPIQIVPEMIRHIRAA